MRTGVLRAIGVLIAAMGIHFSSQAAPCTAFNNYANPDATVTNSTLCGSGNKDNDDDANVNSLAPGGFNDWSQIDRAGNNDDNANQNGILSMTGAGGTLGDWGFDDQTGVDQYLLVIKDGVIPDGSTADAVSWFWFIIDTSAGCTISSFSGQFDYCGTWTMFGENGRAKAISHLTLYARNGGGGDDDEDDDDDEVPEPATLALVGLALSGMALARRRSRKQ